MKYSHNILRMPWRHLDQTNHNARYYVVIICSRLSVTVSDAWTGVRRSMGRKEIID